MKFYFFKNFSKIISPMLRHPIFLFGVPILMFITCVIPPFYPFTLLQSLALQGFGFLLLFTLGLFWIKKFTAFWVSVLALVGISIFLGFHISIFSTQDDRTLKNQKPDLTIAQFNVDFRDGHYDQMIQAILRTDADLVSCQEVSKAWAYQLKEKLAHNYPYHRLHFEYNRGNGLAIFSKRPFQGLGAIRVAKIPLFIGGFKHKKGDIFFTLIHTKSPVKYPNYVLRQKQFDFLKDLYLPQPAQHRFLIGDLNVVPWAEPFSSFVQETDLQDSRKNLSLTYPRNVPIAGIPIDYILHSPQVRCLSLEKITDLGSDHAGIVGKYVLESYDKPQTFAPYLATHTEDEF